jgi:tungstate transport system substrate-binding protein
MQAYSKRFTQVLQAVVAISVGLLAGTGHAQQADIKLSTTTSTENSGLLAYLLPRFEPVCQCKVRVISVGTGKALELARNGDVDVTLVHARPSEDKFVAEGFGVNRRDVMYNDFIVVGPAEDPAGINGAKDVLAALGKINTSGARFISRGDNSGTDQMEKGYWKQLGVPPSGANYVSAGLGMGETISMAAQMRGYTLTDRATFAAIKPAAREGLVIQVQGDARMLNPYGIIAVNPQKWPAVNHKGAMQLVDWMTSTEGQALIAAFRPSGEQLFFPSAK